MKEGSRANALLVELLLVIFFFMLGVTVLVELFAGAKHKTLQARAMNTAVMEAENIADDIYGADDPDAVLTGPETRSSSPVRFSRTIAGEAENLFGLFPAGEGAGYAGGIVSAAADGINAAMNALEKKSII